MPHLPRPQSLAVSSASRPSDRRERHPLQPVGGHPCAPAFERSDVAVHPAAQARPAFDGVPLARIIHMATTGVWVVKRHGRMVEINGRTHWSCQRDLASDARSAGVALSDLIMNTGHRS